MVHGTNTGCRTLVPCGQRRVNLHGYSKQVVILIVYRRKESVDEVTLPTCLAPWNSQCSCSLHWSRGPSTEPQQLHVHLGCSEIESLDESCASRERALGKGLHRNILNSSQSLLEMSLSWSKLSTPLVVEVGECSMATNITSSSEGVLDVLGWKSSDMLQHCFSMPRKVGGRYIWTAHNGTFIKFFNFY